MIHHVSLGTNDVPRAKAFYDPVLKTLHMRLLKSNDRALDYGTTVLFFSLEKPVDGKSATVGNGVHICFAAESRGDVNAFYKAALANGGRDAGAPGVRPEYDDHYYGAFVFDPDGNKIEAVTYAAK